MVTTCLCSHGTAFASAEHPSLATLQGFSGPKSMAVDMAWQALPMHLLVVTEAGALE